ncbi:MAG: hypothetical protein EXR36_12300 [Betaproteobacteria bacterium]|nr:hypothetical protein [Betaproteobacteria bacterium]
MATPQKIRLGDALIKQRLINEQQLKDALDQQRKSGKKLGRVVIEMGLATENQLGIAFVDLERQDINLESARVLTENQARRFRALVLSPTEGAAIVAMSDPTDVLVFGE